MKKSVTSMKARGAGEPAAQRAVRPGLPTRIALTAQEAADYAMLLERAHALLPLLRERAPEAEKLRQLPADVVKAVADAGLFRILQPRHAGGYALPVMSRFCPPFIARTASMWPWCGSWHAGSAPSVSMCSMPMNGPWRCTPARLVP